MRILFTRFPLTSAHGGAENQTMWLAEGLREKGHDVSFLGSCPILLTTFSAAGFGASKLRIGPPPVTRLSALSFLWRRTQMFQRMTQAYESLSKSPEIVVMLSLTEKILMTDWLASRGVKVFWIEHDRIGRWLLRNPWLGALRKASKNATMICVSELSRNMMIQLGFDEKCVIAIPNGVPLPPSSPDPFSRREKGSSVSRGKDLFLLQQDSPTPSGEGSGVRVPSHEGSGVRVGCIARLSPEKGIDVLLRSLEFLPEADLTIVGTGREEGYLRSLIFEDAQKIGVQRARLVHHIADLEKFYHSLDVFVLPSLDHDPFGLVAAEAMVRSIPTVVTDTCGISSYLENGKDALIVQAGSSQMMAEALKKLLDPVLRAKIAAEGQITARTCFTIPAMVDAYEDAMKRRS